MEFLALNLDADTRIRRVTSNGRDYIVVKIKSIPLDGVLPGSQGALFYPAREVINSVPDWDGTPISVYHPIKNGEHVSAADVPEKHVGELRNSRIENGYLTHDGWYDVVKTRAENKQVYDALIHHKPMEISSGLFTTNIPAVGGYGMSPKGRPYQAIATRFRPDHLATLPNQLGACSLQDGCGLNVNRQLTNANPEGHNQYTHQSMDAPEQSGKVSVEHNDVTIGSATRLDKGKDKGKWAAIQGGRQVSTHSSHKDAVSAVVRSHSGGEESKSTEITGYGDDGLPTYGEVVGNFAAHRIQINSGDPQCPT